MAERSTATPETNVSTYRIPRTASVIASLALAVGGVSACGADVKRCEVVETHTMQSGETVWDAIDGRIPEADREASYDKRERMDWIEQVNPDSNPLGPVQAGDKINVPGNCK